VALNTIIPSLSKAKNQNHIFSSNNFRFQEVMKKTSEDGLDMTRMQNIIHKKILEALNNVNIIL
jgi:hypothetical protein